MDNGGLYLTVFWHTNPVSYWRKQTTKLDRMWLALSHGGSKWVSILFRSVQKVAVKHALKASQVLLFEGVGQRVESTLRIHGRYYTVVISSQDYSSKSSSIDILDTSTTPNSAGRDSTVNSNNHTTESTRLTVTIPIDLDSRGAATRGCLAYTSAFFDFFDS